MFKLPLLLLILLSVLPGLKAGLAATIANVTIDDQDSAIFYSAGQWNLSDSYNSLDYEGFHHLSDQSFAFAIFNFTGIAIYFLSPLWPYAVGARLVLDGESPPVFVDLQDHSRPVNSSGGPETVSSAVVWGFENLELGNHSLRIEFAQGQSEYVVLDALIYSYIDTEPSPSPSIPSPVGEPSAMPSNTTIRSSAPASNQSSTTAAVGAVVGGITGLVIIALLFLVLRHQRRKAARLPRIDIPIYEDQSEEYHDRTGSVLESSVTHEATVLSTRSRSAEHLLQLPDKTPAPLPSASKSALNLSPTSLRPSLPPINTKQLPALPPPEEETQSALKYTKSILSAVSKRFTTPASGLAPQSGSTSESATSSFFPRPIFDEDHGMLSISRQQSLRGNRTPGRNSLDGSDTAKISKIGMYPGPTNDKIEIQEARRFPAKPITNRRVASSIGEIVQPPVTIDNPQKKSPHPLPLPTPSVVVNQQAAASKGKSLNPLTIIPENSGSSPSRISLTSAEENNTSSNRISKRLSGGKARVEKERQRRRRPKTLLTPQGPRPRPLPSPPASLSLSAYNTPLPSASSGRSSNTALSSDQSESAANTQCSNRTTPQGHRTLRRRPLPQTYPEARRSSLLLGSHILVPLKSVNPGLANSPGAVADQSSAQEIDALLQSQTDRLRKQKHLEPSLLLNKSESSAGLQSTTVVVSGGHTTDDDGDDKQKHRDQNITSPSPQIEWTLPVLPSLLSSSPNRTSDTISLTTPSFTLLPAPTSRKVALRPRNGQPTHSLSLPDTLLSRPLNPQEPTTDNHQSPTSGVTSTRGPLPPTPSVPLSARSAPEAINHSPRSPRRLPSPPSKHTELSKEMLDVPGAQYLTVPEDLEVAPPPYSGRKIGMSKIPQPKLPTQRLLAREGVPLAEAVSKQPEQAQQKEIAILSSTQAFTRRAPQSIPVTPSEWRTSSTAQSLTTSGSIGRAPRMSGHQDETAAEMLFELLDDAGSPSSSVFTPDTTRPLSIPSKSNRALSVPPPPRQSVLMHSKSFSVAETAAAATRERSYPQQLFRRESVTRAPRISLIPEDEPAPRITVTKTPLSTRNPLVIPPHPITPPPPLPPIPPTLVPAPSTSTELKPRLIRSKVWNSRGVNNRTNVSVDSQSLVSIPFTSSTKSRPRSNSAPQGSQATRTIHHKDTFHSASTHNPTSTSTVAP